MSGLITALLALVKGYDQGATLIDITANGVGCDAVVQDLLDNEPVPNSEIERCRTAMFANLQDATTLVQNTPQTTGTLLAVPRILDPLLTTAKGPRPTSDAALPPDIDPDTTACQVCPEPEAYPGCPTEPGQIPVETELGGPVSPGSFYTYSSFGFGEDNDICALPCLTGSQCTIDTQNYGLKYQLVYEAPGSDAFGHPRLFDCTEQRGFTDIAAPDTYYSGTHRAAVVFIMPDDELGYGTLAEHLLTTQLELVAEPCP